jgi:uncharacterized glyoxalase superfamily protein PhnB
LTVADAPILGQVNIVVREMAAALGFYRRLGWAIEAPTPEHASVELANGVRVELDSVDFVRAWDSGYREATGGSTVLGVSVASRDEVDRLYRDLVAHGGRERQPPYDAFWGARYAIVEDPEANPIGLMSPTDDARRFWPPSPPPTARVAP